MTSFKRNGSGFSRPAAVPSVAPVQAGASRPSTNTQNGGKPKFQNLGSLTVPKSVDAGLRDMILSELRDSDIKLNLKIYLPKGVNSVTLNRDDLVVLTFKINEKDPAFVVGKALLPNNE